MWILFILTLISSAYAIYMQFRCKAFEEGFLLLAKLAYNPKNEQDCIKIIEKINNERIRTEETNNQ